MAARVLGTNQEDSTTTLGLAARDPRPRLPSSIWRVVLPKISASGVGSRDDVRWDGCCGRKGCRARLGVAYQGS